MLLLQSVAGIKLLIIFLVSSLFGLGERELGPLRWKTRESEGQARPDQWCLGRGLDRRILMPVFKQASIARGHQHTPFLYDLISMISRRYRDLC
jgi:hypothetical protein